MSTVLVAVCAEFLVSSIDGLVEGSNISEAFVGLILLPIVGNAAEVRILFWERSDIKALYSGYGGD